MFFTDVHVFRNLCYEKAWSVLGFDFRPAVLRLAFIVRCFMFWKGEAYALADFADIKAVGREGALMGLTVDPYRKAAYAGSDSAPGRQEKAGGKSDFARVLDAVTISGKGREALSASGEAAVSQGAAKTGGAPDNGRLEMQAAFDAQAEGSRAENRPETNWNAVVDPDGSIYSAAYIGAIMSQYQKAEAVARDYYGSARQGNLALDNPDNQERYSDPIHDLLGASFPRPDMPEQGQAMLWGGNAGLNDPYALSSAGGALHNIDEVDRVARSVAQDKLDALIRDWKAAHGISD